MAQGRYSWGYQGTRDKANGLGLYLGKKQGSSDAYFGRVQIDPNILEF